MKKFAFALALLLPFSVVAQQLTLTDIKVRFQGKKREQVEKDAKLSLDDAARRIVVRSKERPLDLSYDDVQKIIIEPDSYAGTIGFGTGLGLLAVGPRLGPKPDKPQKGALLAYIEYKSRDGNSESFVVILGKDSAAEGMNRLKAVFGERVLVPAFEEVPEKLDKKDFKSAKSRYQVRASASEHPLPSLKPDKALVVVAATICWGTYPAGTEKWWYYEGAKILVNDQVVGVNGSGTYTFFYVDPGEHLLISQANDLTGLRIKLEAGKEYYLTQTIVCLPNFKSFLTRHSKEVVMHEVKDLLWAEWKLKDK